MSRKEERGERGKTGFSPLPERTDPDSVDRGRAFGAAHYLIRTMKILLVS